MNVDTLPSAPALPADNPLLAEWPGPHGGVPPFDRVRVHHFVPALDEAIRLALDDVARIAADPEPPTFENTLAALERSCDVLERVRAISGVWRSTMSTPDFQAIEGEMMVKLAAYADTVIQNEDLFRRVETVYHASPESGLTDEQRRLAWLVYTNFVRSGAALGEGEKERLREINQRLAELSTRFDQNVLAAESEGYVVIDHEADLAGLPEPEKHAAAAAAEARGLAGRWVIENTRSAVEPFLTCARDRALRERVWRAFVGRGDTPGERDNKPVLAEILSLRLERARLLGYATHAHWAAERQMAKVPERALELMETVWTAAAEQTRAEAAEIAAMLRSSGTDLRVEPWDYRFHAESVRAPKAGLDWDEVKPYLQLERLREGMFWVAAELFGLEFTPTELPVYHPDVRVWEVKDRFSGRDVGLFYFDPFARKGKKSGAWMNHYRVQERLDREVTPIVSNNCNYLRGLPDEPVLISWMDAKTLFHEFGHALHGLLSDVTYASLAGTSVSTDYVEFPSQMLEHWLSTPEFLGRYAIHWQTGEPLPAGLAARIERAGVVGRGFTTAEEVASGLLDMKLHLATDHPIDPAAFEIRTMEEIDLPPEITFRHRIPHFSHIFSSDHYAAKYYSYLWADVLTADAAEAFREAGGMYDRETAERLRRYVLSRGNSVDAEEGYRAFRGRDPKVEALMRKRGLIAG